MNLPVRTRGLSPEGRLNRERHHGSLSIGIQGTTVQPTDCSKYRQDFIQQNVRRLREIQAKCKERDTNNKRSQPLRATRESSASTNSSTKQIETLAAIKTGSAKVEKKVLTSEREDSAHSDYFSLADEQVENCISHHREQYPLYNQPYSKNPDEQQSRSSSSMSQSFVIPDYPPLVEPPPRPMRPCSPVILKPLTSTHVQTSPRTIDDAQRQSSSACLSLLSGSGLSQGMRKMRMDNLMSKIKNQKPSCEVDYHSHYKNIEYQHKLLLDSSDVLSLYGHSEGIDTQRSSSRLFNAGKIDTKPQKLVRMGSFDRDTLGKKSGQAGQCVKQSGKGVKVLNSRQEASSKLSKKFSNSLSNLAQVSPTKTKETTSKQNCLRTDKEKQVSRERRLKSAKSQSQPYVPHIQRSKSNLDSPGKYKVVRESINNGNLGETLSSADLNQNSTLSSCYDFKLNNECDESLLEDFHLNFQTESEQLENVDHRSEGPLQEGNITSNIEYPDEDYYPEDYMNQYNSATADCGEDHPVAVGESSTVVPNDHNDKTRGTCVPKLLKKREQHRQLQTPATLQRSTSLKNVRQCNGAPPPSYKRGKIPKYILARREEERRLAEIALTVDPECPPGHAPLPDHERRNTLHLLKKSQAEVMRELSSLPVAQDTLRVKKRRQDLEDKLMQIEDGLRIFSQPKVYVMNDDLM